MFERAKRENKPVVLDISAVWCHWCHVMDQTSYSDPEVAAIINSEFVPVRVDNDKRPDINRRYNMGGWPTTAFLAPDGRIISGGTYIPPHQLKIILREIKDYWDKNKERAVAVQAAQHVHEEYELEQQAKPGKLSEAIVTDVFGEVLNNFDPIYGGFGSQPKFPHTDALELALARFHYSGNREFLRIVSRTLEAMARGGIYDREMGGFFRYSTTRDWSIPHFEKMSEDNAKLLALYLKAFQLTGNVEFQRIAEEIVGYVNSTLSNQENGGFYGSQDADEAYYGLPKVERLKHAAPYVDPTLYANWNGLMISTYLLGSFILDREDMRTFALKSLNRIIKILYEPGEGIYHFFDGNRNLPGLLGDQASVAGALLDAFEATGERRYLDLAEEVVSATNRYLYDPESAGYVDRPPDSVSPGFLKKPAKPLDENSLMARALYRLSFLTGKDFYRQRAVDTLRTFVDVYSTYGVMAGEYALAVSLVLGSPTQITIVGSRANVDTQRLVKEALRVYDPRRVLLTLDPGEDADKIKASGYSFSDRATAYVCVAQTCLEPIIEPEQLSPRLAQLIQVPAGR